MNSEAFPQQDAAPTSPATEPSPTAVPPGTSAAGPNEQTAVPFGVAVRTWFAISLQTFGGPAGQIAVMQGALFVLPGVVALLALSAVYVAFGTTTAITAVFTGLAAAVLAIVVQAVIRVAKKALDSRALVALAVASFVALAVFGVPFPVVVALAGLAGWALGRWRPSAP